MDSPVPYLSEVIDGIRVRPVVAARATVGELRRSTDPHFLKESLIVLFYHNLSLIMKNYSPLLLVCGNGQIEFDILQVFGAIEVTRSCSASPLPVPFIVESPAPEVKTEIPCGLK